MKPPEIIEPQGWARPAGYANGVAVSGRTLAIAGQIGWNPVTCKFESDDLVTQVGQALRNVVAIVRTAGGEPVQVVRLTWYLLDKSAYIAARREIGRAYREVMGDHYPAMSLVVVAGLLEDRALVEIEATAILES